MAIIVMIFGAAFVISLIGDWYFETPWSNPFWYLFELLVWGGAIGLSGFSASLTLAGWLISSLVYWVFDGAFLFAFTSLLTYIILAIGLRVCRVYLASSIKSRRKRITRKMQRTETMLRFESTRRSESSTVLKVGGAASVSDF